LQLHRNSTENGSSKPRAISRPRCGVLVPVLLAILTSCSKPAQQQSSVFVDPALSTLVSADTNLLAGARIDAMTKTAVFQKLAQSPVVQDIAHRTNIDPQRSLWHVMFAANGRRGLVLTRGKFTDELIAPDLRADGIDRMGYKGLTMFGNEQDALLFFNSSTAVIGDTGAIRALVDERPSIKGLPARFEPLVKSIPKEAQIWGAYAGGPVDLSLRGNLANIVNVLHMLQSGTFYATVDEKLHITASLLAESDQKADDLNGAIQALSALTKTPAQVSKDGRRIGVKFDLTVP
jgi:hypothetical protein